MTPRIIGAGLRAILCAGSMSAAAQRAIAQAAASETPGATPAPTSASGGSANQLGRTFGLPFRVSGEASSSAEAYQARGIDSRRPGGTWNMTLTPQVTFFGEWSIGVNVLLSSQGSQTRQEMSQLGLNPRYKWATFHVGDFAQSYSDYTIEGTRLRGGGVDLRPKSGALRFSAQAGRSQRVVAAGAGNMAYRRSLVAASVGIGKEGTNAIDFTVLRARDDPKSLAPALADTTLLDTIPLALRPRIETRPQDNLVLGTKASLGLFQRRVVINGQAAGALITRDVDSPDATAQSVSGGSTYGSLLPLKLSTSGDYAYRVEAEGNFARGGLTAGYEYVGAGYTSLGLAYLINDKRAYTLGGNLRLLDNHLSLQTQYQHQNDNLLGQKIATTNRDAVTATALLVAGGRFSQSVTAVLNTIANDAAVDTFRVDNHALALMTSSMVQTSLLGRPTPISLSYALQRTADANAVTQIPQITVHNVSTAVQIPLFGTLSVSPTASLALTENSRAPTQRNTYFGFRGQARSRSVRASFSATQTFSNARGVFGLNGQLSYTAPLGARVTFQARHNRYAAIGNRPAFQESFATIGLARSF